MRVEINPTSVAPVDHYEVCRDFGALFMGLKVSLIYFSPLERNENAVVCLRINLRI